MKRRKGREGGKRKLRDEDMDDRWMHGRVEEEKKGRRMNGWILSLQSTRYK